MKTPEEYELRIIEKNAQKQQMIADLEQKHNVSGTPEEKLEQVSEQVQTLKEEKQQQDDADQVQETIEQ